MKTFFTIVFLGATGVGSALLMGGLSYEYEFWSRHTLAKPFFYTSGSDRAIGPGAGLLAAGIAGLLVRNRLSSLATRYGIMSFASTFLVDLGAYWVAGEGAYLIEFWLYYPHLSNKSYTSDWVTYTGWGSGLFAVGVASLAVFKDKRGPC
jgi:hypothetical protein